MDVVDEMCGVGCNAGEADDAGFSVEEAGGAGESADGKADAGCSAVESDVID